MGMEMLSAATEALVIMLDPTRLMFLSAGAVLGLILGILPGIGGLAGTVLHSCAAGGGLTVAGGWSTSLFTT